MLCADVHLVCMVCSLGQAGAYLLCMLSWWHGFKLGTLSDKYRLYHEVEVSARFIHRGPQARGCINHVETDTE